MRMMKALILACLLAAAGCSTENGSRIVPGGPDAGCPAMPVECPEILECQVSLAPSGERVCTGLSCCQSFCEQNGCDQCCARP
jgi:hypothetical protein